MRSRWRWMLAVVAPPALFAAARGDGRVDKAKPGWLRGPVRTAAFSVCLTGATPKQVDVAALQRRLVEGGAILAAQANAD